MQRSRRERPWRRGARRTPRPGGGGSRTSVGMRVRQKRDSVTVGAVPDDYRTNHPIVIAERREAGPARWVRPDRGATASQRAALEGLFANYDKSAAPVVNIVAPVGSTNAAAAANAAQDFAHIARDNGVPANRIMLASYQASAEEVSAPVRVMFSAMRAQTDKCGRWPEDLMQTSENKHYADFGCSYQNNVAAQIANPNDLLGAAQAVSDRRRQPRDRDRRLSGRRIRLRREYRLLTRAKFGGKGTMIKSGVRQPGRKRGSDTGDRGDAGAAAGAAYLHPGILRDGRRRPADRAGRRRSPHGQGPSQGPYGRCGDCDRALQGGADAEPDHPGVAQGAEGDAPDPSTSSPNIAIRRPRWS